MTMASSAFFTTLAHEGVLAVRGPDAAKFLQGQLTCNLNYVGEHSASLGARCTQKGRMQSSFRIVQQGDGYLLAMAHELIAAQLADLQKYAVFSKSKLTDESAQWVRFGVSNGDDALALLGLALPDQETAIAADSNPVARNGDLLTLRVSLDRSDASRWELWVPATQAEAVHAQLATQLAQAPLNEWLLGQIRDGIGQVMGPTREVFIPQMLNLQAVGGVSFKKGCYTGQEIVARMQYLGKLKRRLYRLSMPGVGLTGGELPVPGTELFSPVHGSSIGEVVLAAQAPERVEMLAVLQDNAVADGRIYLAGDDGQAPEQASNLLLELLDIPYTLDTQREIQR